MVTRVVPFNFKKANQRKANNKHEETKKVIFNQSAWAALKVAIEKLIQDLFLREKMSKEWALALESERVQSLKDAMEKLFVVILKEINQKIKDSQLTPLQRKTINEKLDNLFKHVDSLVNLKAEFAGEQQVIADRIDTIETGLSEIETELVAPLMIEPARLAILDKKAAALSKEVDLARNIIDHWLSRFSEAFEAKEESLTDLIGSIPEIDTKSDFIKSLEESFGMSNINSNLEKDLLRGYRKEVDGFALRIKEVQSQIDKRRNNPYAFWDTPAPRPSFSISAKKLLDEKDESLLGLFKR